MNVLLNSLEAMPKGGSILIKARPPRGKQRRVRLEVKDTGVGIRKSDIPKVCSPDFSTKGKRQGFGLFIIQRVMEDYKGKVTLHSVRGTGTTVILDLPLI
jgi:two-component system CheB/CheR fusion protein